MGQLPMSGDRFKILKERLGGAGLIKGKMKKTLDLSASSFPIMWERVRILAAI